MTAQIGRKQNYWVILPAAGSGKRMQAGLNYTKENNLPKQYLEIQGKTILEHTLQKIDKIDGISGIVLVLDEQDSWWPQLEITIKTPLITTTGGVERAHSVLNGLKALAEKAQSEDWVLVHDVVRPCVRLEDINVLIHELTDNETGGLLATPVLETLKEISSGHVVRKTVPRENYCLAGTPQMFIFEKLKAALEQAMASQIQITDEAHAMELAGYDVILVDSSAENIKITHREDLLLAEMILSRQNND